MTLREQIADDLETVFLNTDDFACAVAYTPKAGQPRSVVMCIDRRRSFRDDVSGLTNVEIAECRCLRDASNATRGGIATPQIGDTILLPQTEDPEQRPFAYAGIADDLSPNDWVLHFTRDIIFRQGGSDQTGKR